MAKKLRKTHWPVVLAIDIGGTKLAVAVVDKKGQILTQNREPIFLSKGPNGLIDQITKLSKPLIKKYKIKKGALASAGPLDPVSGELLNPTNLKTNGKYWGLVPVVSLLKKKLGIKLNLENDAAAAVLAESWVGESRGTKDSILVTLGTGLGVGVVCNGKLVRAGRHLHTELGHIVLDYQDTEWLCGCGNYGCAEAYLSGVNFTKKLAADWKDLGLTGQALVVRAKSGDRTALAAFEAYGERLAHFLYSLCVSFCPSQIVISGGFSHSADLFVPFTMKRLEGLLATRREGHDLLPKINISRFQDEAGILGAARVAFLQK